MTPRDRAHLAATSWAERQFRRDALDTDVGSFAAEYAAYLDGLPAGETAPTPHEFWLAVMSDSELRERSDWKGLRS